MKTLPNLTAILAAAVLAGCLSSSSQYPHPYPYPCCDRDGVQIDMEAFKLRAEARLREFECRLEELRNRAADARVEVRAALQRDIEELRLRTDAARCRLAELRSAQAERWYEQRLRTEAALEDVRLGFEKAFAHFQ